MAVTVAMTLDLRGLTVPLPVWARATDNRLVEQTQGTGWYRFVFQKR